MLPSEFGGINLALLVPQVVFVVKCWYSMEYACYKGWFTKHFGSKYLNESWKSEKKISGIIDFEEAVKSLVQKP